MNEIEALMSHFPPAQREALDRTRQTVERLLPGAVEVVAWQMPTYRVGPANVLSVYGFSRHNSVFPHSGTVFTQLADQLSDYTVTKGTIHFAVDKPFPAKLLREIVRVRLNEINASYPKPNGEFLEFYDNGRLKSKGRMRGEAMVGSWEWFRRDGSKLRSGSFKEGSRTGAWVTYDRDSQPVRTTEF